MPDIRDLQQHPIALCVLCALWAAVSLTMIVCLWVLRREADAFRKVLWTVILLIPLAGWIFYGGFFDMPDRHSEPPSSPSSHPPGVW